MMSSLSATLLPMWRMLLSHPLEDILRLSFVIAFIHWLTGFSVFQSNSRSMSIRTAGALSSLTVFTFSTITHGFDNVPIMSVILSHSTKNLSSFFTGSRLSGLGNFKRIPNICVWNKFFCIFIYVISHISRK